MQGKTGSESWQEVWDKSVNGPRALIDCWQEIPCDPCQEACAQGSIVLSSGICAPPALHAEKCNGCGKCVAICPGMAIFLVDRSIGSGLARVTVPYEMRDEIRLGGEAWAVDGEGNYLAEGRITRVSGAGRPGRTMLLTIEVPEEWALKVRGVRGRRKLLEEPEEVEAIEAVEDFAFCRCEEIDYSRLREIITQGEFRSLPALRRFSRAGLGYCQGRFCQSILRSQFLADCPEEDREVESFRVRAPVRPVKLSRLGGEDG
ncbi:MAG: hypothetical protein A2Y75_02450 [Candidatus Solincola sediminis]|uniref:4Fe-4S ferredoxin-type domain-containing protein n=1 Tax=Candidatus Solincola sediminis TaxID=1797199 RepID=A0A1F2WTM0_9ACTN|nr:MAG: hypothetical protein A2Y75_02450 [Candidatus Solincola sediminis]